MKVDFFPRADGLVVAKFTGTTKFSNYVLETSDDNLFLRTCFCKKDWQLEDRELDDDVTHAVVAFQHRFKEERLTCKFTRKPFPFVKTLTKMQVCFVNEAEVEDKIAWNKSMGYPHCYVIKLTESKS